MNLNYKQKFQLKEKELKEEVDISKAIKDFIEIKWSENEEEKGQALSQLKGIMYSDDPKAKKFIQDLDKASNSLNVEDYS